MNAQLVLPEFTNEDEEREFWATIDLSNYFAPEDFEEALFPNLSPTLQENALDKDAFHLS